MQAARQTSRNTLRGRERKATSDVSGADRSAALCADPEDPELKATPVPDPPDPSAPPSPPRPSPDLVQSSLVAALQSREFRSAPQLRSFLGFIVRATLNDEQEKLKGYTIAVEALGRPEDFNPVTDPIVRVEAARLRRRLEKYYAGSGAGDPVRIVIPKGSYAPEFRTLSAGEPAKQSAEAMLAFAEDSADYKPQAAALPVQNNTRSSATLPDPDLSGEARPQAASPAGQTGTSRAPLPRTGLLDRTVSLPLAVLVAALCFFAGYLSATL